MQKKLLFVAEVLFCVYADFWANKDAVENCKNTCCSLPKYLNLVFRSDLVREFQMRPLSARLNADIYSAFLPSLEFSGMHARETDSLRKQFLIKPGFTFGRSALVSTA